MKPTYLVKVEDWEASGRNRDWDSPVHRVTLTRRPDALSYEPLGVSLYYDEPRRSVFIPYSRVISITAITIPDPDLEDEAQQDAFERWQDEQTMRNLEEER